MTNSLQSRLISWQAACILLVGAIAGFISFFSAFQEAYEFQDDQLIQVAALINSQILSVAEHSGLPVVVKDNDSRFTVQVLGQRSEHALPLPSNMANGFQTLLLKRRSWRFYVRSLADGRRVAVGQSTEGRDELARDSGVRTAMPFLILLPLLVTLIVVSVRRTFAPVERLSSDIDARGQNDLRELELDGAPQEIKPFLHSINGLLARLTRTLAEQRRFIADAAHELRSPITALLLQTANVERAVLDPEARLRVASLKAGLQRTRALLEQLLAMARSQSSPQDPIEDLPLASVMCQALRECEPLAQARNVALALHDQSGQAQLSATRADVLAMLRNLLDNAIRYTPPHGMVEIALRAVAGEIEVSIADSGPGIAAADKARVFDPFFRVGGSDDFGSGLGLAIVRTIVERLHGQVFLEDVSATPPHGLLVRLILPRSRDGSRPKLSPVN